MADAIALRFMPKILPLPAKLAVSRFSSLLQYRTANIIYSQFLCQGFQEISNVEVLEAVFIGVMTDRAD